VGREQGTGQIEGIEEGLLDPAAYPWLPATVEYIETHVSWVYFAGDHVVKIKRPVAFPFVDHRDPQRRRQSCLDEVRLNRRLTDGVYLGVVPVVLTPSGFRVDAEGEPVELATLMRRMPASNMLDVALTSRKAPADLADRLAARLVPFHRDLSPACEGDATTWTAVVTDNLDEIAPFAGRALSASQFELVDQALRRFARDHDALLQRRVSEGWIREGHGDLRAEHVCIEPGHLQIYDCVEFNRDLRCADVASDLVYFLMDLTRLGARHVATDLLGRYRTAGIDLPDALIRFYGAHRALVRVKVSCLELSDAHAEARGDLIRDAADYLNMASAAALTVEPALFVMTGLSGSGKSTVATAISRALDLDGLVADVVRKELAGDAGLAKGRWQEGLYAPQWTAATYDEMFARAETRLSSGHPVLLDGTFLDNRWRETAARLAESRQVPLVLVETVADPDVVVRRISARQRQPDNITDATVEIFQRQLAATTARPLSVPPSALFLRINTTPDGPVEMDPLWQLLDEAGIITSRLPDDPWFG
jgi:aminoglycoside phosphotransferase family enzyme/predicted kinase